MALLGLSARLANLTADCRFTLLKSSAAAGIRTNKHFKTVPLCRLNFHFEPPMSVRFVETLFVLSTSQFLPKHCPQMPSLVDCFSPLSSCELVLLVCHMSRLVCPILGGARCRPHRPQVALSQRRLRSAQSEESPFSPLPMLAWLI